MQCNVQFQNIPFLSNLQTNIKITASESVDMQYILFPLKTGLLKTPKLVIDTVSPGSGQDSRDKSDSPAIVHKNIVKHIFVAVRLLFAYIFSFTK